MDTYESRLADLHLPPKEWINQVGKSDNIRNSSSWKYLTELILDALKYPEGGKKYIPTNQTKSDPNHNPRGSLINVPGSSSPGFGYSGRYPSGSPSDK